MQTFSAELTFLKSLMSVSACTAQQPLGTELRASFVPLSWVPVFQRNQDTKKFRESGC